MTSADSPLAGGDAEWMNLRAALDAAAIVTVTDARGVILEANDHFCDICGYARDELVGRTHALLKSGVHDAAFFRHLWTTIRDGRVWHGEICNRARDGRLVWLDTTIVPFLDSQGRLDRFFSIRHDITARKAVEAELERSRANLARAQEIAQLGSWEMDFARDEVTASPVAFRLHGLEPVDGPVPSDVFTRRVHVDDRLRVEQDLLGLMSGGESARIEFRVWHSDGSLRHLITEAVAVAGDGDVPGHEGDQGDAHPIRGLIGTVQDITERRTSEERLSFLALRDPLTGLPNRRLFHDRLQHALDTAKRTEAPLAVLFLDLDRFKTINDGLGHNIGDRLLQEVSARLMGELREADTVSRLGGDEFAVLLEDVDGRAAAALTARKLIEALRAPMVIDGHRLSVSGSIGVALYPEDGDTAEALLKNADTAMYGAKDIGRDSFKLYAAEMGQGLSRRLTLLNGLQSALFDGGFRIHYQPQVDLSNGEICGAEALLRWSHPVLGAVTPTEFVPLLEETGLIGSVGEWVLHTACRDASLWRDDGTPVRVAVNVSYRQIQQGTLPGIVARALDASDLDPDLLELELTESMLAEDTDLTIDVLKKCRDLGVSISIDDFGTGYSSLGHLKRFPVNVLKTDKCFTQGAPGERHDAAIIGAVATLAQRLGLTLVAEGIEEAASADYLRYLGCDIGQGYYFGRPMPKDRLSEMLLN